MYTVTSEIYKETNFKPIKGKDGKVTSKFEFKYPEIHKDKDGDYEVTRKGEPHNCGVIELQHSDATEIKLVGLQVWRGALLLADYIFHKRQDFKDKQLLELGAGVGLTSLAAAFYVKKVVCTDVDIGGILDLIRNNVKLNSQLCDTGKINVMEYDFMQEVSSYKPELLKAIDESDIVFAADTIYCDDLTNAFINVIDIILQRGEVSGRKKEIYIALEKRYVFTFSELDAVAPMFEYFLKQTLHKPWKFEYVETDFTQYFKYERCKHLVLLKITKQF
ncbi:methyltransferase-like protein 22 [Haematobia irritans]|uniref:methyltransferase-like protein 22 n=1 Tax=Haematobia irritans TaxID=7368 RepID=UPI003F4F9066